MKLLCLRIAFFLLIVQAGLLAQQTDVEKINAAIEKRINIDCQELADIISQRESSAKTQIKILKEIKRLKSSIDENFSQIDPKTFRAIVPVNKTHEKLFVLFSEVLRKEGFSGLQVWHKYRYAPLSVFEFPNKTKPCISIETMSNEHRGDVFNLTNCYENSIEVRFRIENLPGGTNPSYLKPHQVEYVDTRKGQVIASALVELTPNDGWYLTNIPSGMTRQIWISSFPREIKAGKYKGIVSIQGPLENKNISINISIAPIRMPDQLDVSCGMWDYSHTTARGLTKQTMPLAIQDMKSHYIDVPWGLPHVLPKVRQDDFDRNGNLIGKIDFREFDKWVKHWPVAKKFLIFAAIKPKSKFAGIARKLPQFEEAVSQWAKAWAEHNRQIGLKPSQVGILFVDEPRKLEQVQTSIDWMKAFRKGTEDIAVFVDPLASWVKKEHLSYHEEMFKLSDIICFNTKNYIRIKDKDYKSAIERTLNSKDKELWFYICSGPVRNFDPAYYRVQPWYAFSQGAVNSSFWAYGDIRSKSNWNEYIAKGTNFSPVYLDETSVTNSKHWEALREGLQDYQYLKMWTARSDKSNQSLSQFLPDIIKRYISTGACRNDWSSGELCEMADSARLIILHQMISSGYVRFPAKH